MAGNELKINRETLSSRVCGQLRREILGGEHRSGERLNESLIAERFGVSPTPVREAMRLLVNDGLVEYVDRKGVRVITLSEREIRQAFSVRTAIEREALQEALVLMTKADRTHLLELAMRTRDASGRGASALLEVDRNFHAFFVERSDNTWLREFSMRMSNVLTVARVDLFHDPDVETVVTEHVAIARAVLDGDDGSALHELEAHIRRVCASAIAAHKRARAVPEAAGKGEA